MKIYNVWMLQNFEMFGMIEYLYNSIFEMFEVWKFLKFQIFQFFSENFESIFFLKKHCKVGI